MSISEHRARALAAREAAAETQLPQRRALLEASALRWEEMVRLSEQTAARALENEKERLSARLDRERRGIVLGCRASASDEEPRCRLASPAASGNR